MPRKPKPATIAPAKRKPLAITSAQRAAILAALRDGAPARGATRRAAQLTGASLADVRRIAVEAGVRATSGRKPTVARVITVRLTAEESARLTEVAGGYSQVTAWAREALRRAAGVA